MLAKKQWQVNLLETVMPKNIVSERHTFTNTTSQVVIDSQRINNIKMFGNKRLALIFLTARENSIH